MGSIASIADVSEDEIESLKSELRSQNFECLECTLGRPGVELMPAKWGRTEFGHCNLPCGSIVTDLEKKLQEMSTKCCGDEMTDGLCLSVTWPHKITWMFSWISSHIAQVLCVPNF